MTPQRDPHTGRFMSAAQTAEAERKIDEALAHMGGEFPRRPLLTPLARPLAAYRADGGVTALIRAALLVVAFVIACVVVTVVVTS